MSRLAALFLVALLSGCVATAAKIPMDYAGVDAGKVVVGLGSTADAGFYEYYLAFRRLDAEVEPPPSGVFTYVQRKVFGATDKPDYKNDEELGVVLVKSLAPGRYEIHGLSVTQYDSSLGSRIAFSIPFTIQPGQTTYLGNYQGQRVARGKNVFGMTLPGFVFVVSDRFDAELALAHKKSATLPASGQNATPDVKSLRYPLLISPDMVPKRE